MPRNSLRWQTLGIADVKTAGEFLRLHSPQPHESGMSRNSDDRSARSERPVLEKVSFTLFNVRFRENALHCCEVVLDLMDARPRISLHQHRAGLSAEQLFGG